MRITLCKKCQMPTKEKKSKKKQKKKNSNYRRVSMHFFTEPLLFDTVVLHMQRRCISVPVTWPTMRVMDEPHLSTSLDIVIYTTPIARIIIIMMMMMLMKQKMLLKHNKLKETPKSHKIILLHAIMLLQRITIMWIWIMTRFNLHWCMMVISMSIWCRIQ